MPPRAAAHGWAAQCRDHGAGIVSTSGPPSTGPWEAIPAVPRRAPRLPVASPMAARPACRACTCLRCRATVSDTSGSGSRADGPPAPVGGVVRHTAGRREPIGGGTPPRARRGTRIRGDGRPPRRPASHASARRPCPRRSTGAAAAGRPRGEPGRLGGRRRRGTRCPQSPPAARPARPAGRDQGSRDTRRLWGHQDRPTTTHRHHLAPLSQRSRNVRRRGDRLDLRKSGNRTRGLARRTSRLRSRPHGLPMSC